MSRESSRSPEFDIDPLFTERWSPRAYTGEAIGEAELFSLFEAARWAPSAYNSQPWRFIYARRDSPAWVSLFSLLAERNQRWVTKAAALVFLVSKTTHVRPGEAEPSSLGNHSLDAGAAWANLSLQAIRTGWRTRAIGGFNRERAKDVLGVPDGYRIEVAIAVGRQGDRSSLPEEFQSLEVPTPRLPVRQLVAEGRFAFGEH